MRRIYTADLGQKMASALVVDGGRRAAGVAQLPRQTMAKNAGVAE
jgi:hypothetical protein